MSVNRTDPVSGWDAGRIREKLAEARVPSPRLLFPEESPEVARQRVSASPGCRSLLDEIRQEGAELLAEQLPELPYTVFRLFSETGSRSEYERIYFRRRRRLTTFSLLAWLEPDNKVYLDAACDAVWAVCDEYTWCLSAHILNGPEMKPAYGSSVRREAEGERDDYTIDLFAAETAFALSEIGMLLAGALPDILQRRIRAEVFRRVLRPFVSRGPFTWETAHHNWASVCAGSVGCAALYLLEDEEELAEVLERVLRAEAAYLGGFAADGACTEGYGYWEYGFGFYVYFADMLKSRTCGAIDLFAAEKVREIALFQQKCFLDGRRVVNFSDSPLEVGIFLGLAHYLNGVYSGVQVPESRLRAAYADDHCSRWAPALRNLIWYRDEAAEAPWGAGTCYLEDAQWFISRSDGPCGRIAFAAKGGHNDEPHNHNDIGQFTLVAGGTALIADLGRGLYTRDYFGEKRYDILCNGAQGHGVPVINGRLQRPGREAAAHVLEASVGGELERFAVDISSAYGLEALHRLERHFVWDKAKARLELTDRYLFDCGPESVAERLVSWYKPEPLEEGCLAIRSETAELRIRFDSGQLEWTVERQVHRGHFGEESDCYLLDFHVKRPSADESVQLIFQIAQPS